MAILRNGRNTTNMVSNGDRLNSSKALAVVLEALALAIPLVVSTSRDSVLLVVLAASVISLRLSSDARASRVVASEVSKASVVRAQVLQRAPIRAR